VIVHVLFCVTVCYWHFQQTTPMQNTHAQSMSTTIGIDYGITNDFSKRPNYSPSVSLIRRTDYEPRWQLF